LRGCGYHDASLASSFVAGGSRPGNVNYFPTRGSSLMRLLDKLLFRDSNQVQNQHMIDLIALKIRMIREIRCWEFYLTDLIAAIFS
jgi:hypothetical protein